MDIASIEAAVLPLHGSLRSSLARYDSCPIHLTPPRPWYRANEVWLAFRCA
jgi:hypothetical protein